MAMLGSEEICVGLEEEQAEGKGPVSDWPFPSAFPSSNPM